MSTFDDDERSVSRSRPIDLYRITTPTVIYYLTSYVVDVTYAGQVYTATTMSRGNQTVAQDLTGRELIVYLPITHPLVQRYAASGVPDREAIITVYRLQQRSGVAVQFHSGFGQSISCDDHTASIRVPSITDDAFKIRLPTLRGQKLCNHILYDAQCKVDRTLASGPARITAIAGSTVTVDVALVGEGIVFGDVVHDASGELRMVIGQDGSLLFLNVPFVGLAIGDNVTIHPGCDHSLLTCKNSFSNVVNFGGMPHMNTTIHPFSPGTIGTIVQQ